MKAMYTYEEKLRRERGGRKEGTGERKEKGKGEGRAKGRVYLDPGVCRNATSDLGAHVDRASVH